VRVDHGLREGERVSAAFDPMLAKVAAHGADRAQAIARLHGALRDTVILGTTTNTDYLARVVDHAAFRAGSTHTGFLEEHAGELRPAAHDPGDERLVIAAAALAGPHFDRRATLPEPLGAMGAWRP
jgi:acetyl/propionyl-CoA carboxylase alpha subunit